MRKYWYRKTLIAVLVLTVAFGGSYYSEAYYREQEKAEVSTGNINQDTVLLGGMPAGIYMETSGVMVLDTASIKGKDGMEYEPANHLVKPGDYITRCNGTEVSNKKQLQQLLSELDKEEVILSLRRDKDTFEVKLTAVSCGTNDYKLGIWVRDNVQGLGTVTFLTENNEFGALGHGIHDSDTNTLLEISDGTLYETNIRSVSKGKDGYPGSMEGIIVYNNYNKIGDIRSNTEAGIYGTLTKLDRLFEEQIPIETGKKEEAVVGPATIRCYVNGELREFDIQILDIDYSEKEVNKGLVLQVTDQELLNATGGIIQGMSGSPIIQNDKIIGAVTHVFVQDATKGYGIFIENMLENLN